MTLTVAIWQAARNLFPGNPKACLLAVDDNPRSGLAIALAEEVRHVIAGNR